jgi:hypothetical protein
MSSMHRITSIVSALLAVAACTPPQSQTETATEAVADAPSEPQARLTRAGTPLYDHGGDLTGVWTNNPPEAARAFQNFAFSSELPPMTPWAQERYEAARPTFGPRGVPVAETNDPVYQCFPPGTPRIYFHPFPMEIIQLPGRVVMLFEYDHLIRQIYTDGRPHRDDLAPMWMGDSTGHWEGDTLVVETVNLNGMTWVDRRGVPTSDQLRVVERIRRIDDNNLQIDITVEDPVAFTQPWSGQRFYRTVDWNVEEFVCMDNVGFAEWEDQILEYDGEPATGEAPPNAEPSAGGGY